MKKLILWILIGMTVGLFSGFYITAKFLMESIPKDYVCVTVYNKSGQKIKSLVLKHEKGTLEMKDFPDNETTKFIFKNKGENSFQVFATLENDSTLITSKEYIESGYRIAEIIYEEHIETKR
jgi:hypothetical protein